MSVDQKRDLISPKNSLSLRRQCTLLGLARSTKHYRSEPLDETEWMNLIADIHGKRPVYGYRKIVVKLKEQGHTINGKKVKRLMKQMGLRKPPPETSNVNS